jgi:hypothetical protein
VFGCDAFAGPSTIDGFTPGDIVRCSPPVGVTAEDLRASCAGDLERATDALDSRDPGHAPIVSVESYADGSQPPPVDVTGGDAPPPRATPYPGLNVTVYMFKLADGSTRATGVACAKDAVHMCVGVGRYP